MKFLGTIKEDGVTVIKDRKITPQYKIKRTTVRFIIFDKDKKIALNHRPEQDGYLEQHALPGGGVEKGESVEEALKREALEEIGAELKEVEELGFMIDYGESPNLMQKTFYFTGRVKGKKREPVFTESEKKSGLGVVWLPLDEAVVKVAESSDGFSKTRGLLVLGEVTKKTGGLDS